MTEELKKGLLAIWSDVDPDYRVQFQKWHNCEHIRERVAIPGFFVGRRYQGIGKGPHFLMCYETEDSNILASEPYLRAVNHPSPWTKEVIAHSKNIVRGIYRMVFMAGEKPPTEAPYLVVLKFNPGLGREREIPQWYGETQLQKVSDIHGVHRSRLYQVDEEISHIKTEERRIHGGGPDQQKFLGMFEVESLNIRDSKAWQELNRKVKHTKKMKDVRYEAYWLDFVMYAPVNNR